MKTHITPTCLGDFIRMQMADRNDRNEAYSIHPFNNGNRRTGRILMNIVALKFGYKPLEFYYREGDSRKTYIDAMKFADKGNFEPLTTLIRKELTTF